MSWLMLERKRLLARLAASEAGRHQAELDATRAQEECRRWQLQADTAERETRRLQAELARMERAKIDVEQAESEAKEAEAGVGGKRPTDIVFERHRGIGIDSWLYV